MAGLYDNALFRTQVPGARLVEPIPPPAPKTVTINWSGASGTTYGLGLYEIGAAFYEKPGVYIFCHELPNGRWKAIYVGETHNFKNRLSDKLLDHHAYPGALIWGATHICAVVVPGPLALREGIETDLRRALQPPLNKQ